MRGHGLDPKSPTADRIVRQLPSARNPQQLLRIASDLWCGNRARRGRLSTMKAVLRTLAAVFAGLLVLFILVVAVELFSAVVHPLPEDFGGTTEEMCRHVERYPQWVLAV